MGQGESKPEGGSAATATAAAVAAPVLAEAKADGGKSLLDFFSRAKDKAKDAEPAPALPDESTPRLVLVLPNLEGQAPSAMKEEDQRRRYLQQALRFALCAEGFHVQRLVFPPEGGLKGKEGWAIAMNASRLELAAEAEGLRKRHLWKAQVYGEKEEQEFEHWVEYSKEVWRLQNKGHASFEQSEALSVQQARAYSAVLPPHWQPEADGEKFGVLRVLAGCSSVLALAEHAGAVEQVVALHDHALNSDLHHKWPRILDRRNLPLEDAAKYFGVQTAQYFLFLHEYTSWLMLPAFLGVVLHLGHEVSGSTSSIVTTKGAGMFMTFMTLWSTLFIEHWKRKRFELNYKCGMHQEGERTFDPEAPAVFQVGGGALSEAWKLLRRGQDSNESAERVLKRCRYKQNVQKLVEKNENESILRKLKVVIFFARTVIPMVLLLVMVSVVVHLLLWVGEVAEKRFESVVMQNLPVVLYLVVAYFLEQWYLKIGARLTHWEGHPIYAEHLKSLTSKAALFQLVNYLGWFLYVAFWMRDIALLQSQLMMFMTVKQVIALSLETVVPLMKHHFSHKKKVEKAEDPLTNAGTTPAPASGDSGSAEGLRQRKGSAKAETAEAAGKAVLEAKCEEELSLNKVDLGGEYLQLAVLFATTTGFAVAFPLGPLFALVHTMVSRYTDAFKLLKLSQRAPPRCADVVVSDCWLEIFEAISTCAVVVNFGCWALADETGWTPLQIVALEHAVLFFKFYAAWAIPDRPQVVQQKEVAYDVLRRQDAIAPPSI